MATPAAAAALFQKALPKPSDANSNAVASGSGQRGGRGNGRPNRGGPVGGRNGLGRGRTHGTDGDDVGMSDVGAESGAKRRGRQGARAGPMGERPNRGRGRPGATSGRNSPALIRDQGKRASSTPAPSKDERSTGSTIDTLKLFLLSRYVADARMLNMENMAEDPVLRDAKLLAPGQVGAPANMAPAIWKLAAEMFPSVITLSLANNNLTSLLPISPWALTSSLTSIENVSFANNQLKHLRDLDPFSPHFGKARNDGRKKGWPHLKELILLGNPLVPTDAEGSREYQVQVARRFAKLTTLDQQPIDPTIAFTASESGSLGALTPGLSPSVKSQKSKAKAKREPIVFPVPTAPGFFESEATRDFVGAFLTKFFPAYDDDRKSLEAAYAPVCTFSFATDTAPNVRSRAKKLGTTGDKRFPNQHKLDWKSYLGPEGSRNLTRVKYPIKRIATLKVDPAAVVKSLLTLPRTKHPLEDPSKFVFDTWTMPGVLAPVAPDQPGETVIFAVVHGEFLELPVKGTRSFDRTFILAPAPPGSPAHAAGWPCIILSDMLTIRNYADPKVWQPPTAPSAPTGPRGPTGNVPTAPVPGAQPPAGVPHVPVGVPPQSQERAEGVTDEQQVLVLQLQSLTRLTYTFAHMCLVQNNWDPTTALANFETLRAQGTIPPEAFVSGP